MKLLRYMGSIERGLHGAAFVLALSTIASQVLALIRDRLLAGTFGVGEFLDVYYAAFRVPDFLFVSVASLFSAAVIIPFLVSRLENSDAPGSFLSSLVVVFLGMMGVIAGLVFVLMPTLAPLVAPGLGPEQYETLISFSRILLLSPVFLGLSSILAGATQAVRSFVVFSLTPIVYNCGIIFGISVLYPLMGPTGVVWGVVIGAVLHMVVQIPVIVRQGLYAPAQNIFREVVPVFLTSIPRTIALSMTHIQLIVFTALASLFAVGAISAFQLGYNLQSIPLSLIGVSYSVAAFPSLSQWWAAGKYLVFTEALRRAEGHVIVWSLLLSALFVILRDDIVSVVLGVGAFHSGDVARVAMVLGVFSCSLVFQGLILLYSRAYYAMHETKKPLVANGTGAVIAIVVAYVLPSHLVVYGFDALLALPLAFGVGAIVSVGLLRMWYTREIGALSSYTLWLHAGVAVCIISLLLPVLLRMYAGLFGSGAAWQTFTTAACAGVDAAGVAVIYLYMVGVAPVVELIQALSAKIRG